MRAKVITVVSILVVVIGLIALIQFNSSSKAPVQGVTADPIRGDTTAPVTIEEYSDFQCPACKSLEPVLEKVLQDFPGQVQLVYNDFPLTTIHDHAVATAEAGQCALAQDKFWEYHDLLFQRQSLWAQATDITAVLTEYAVELGLDSTQFSTCLASDETVPSITEDTAEGKQAKVSSTPTLFVNGERLIGPTYDTLHAAVAKELGQ